MRFTTSFLARQLIKRCKYLAAIPGGTVTPCELIPHEWKGKRAVTIRERHDNTMLLEYGEHKFKIPSHAYNWVSVFVGEIMLSDIYRLSLIKPKPGSFIYDCGANVGVYTVAAAAAFPECRILAIEPEEQNRWYLQQNIELNGLQNRVFVLDAAVHRYDDEQALLILHESGDHYLAGHANGESNKGVPVRTVSLNSLAREFQPVDCIKMDIQGAELETVLGADKLLHRDFPAWSIAAYHDKNQFSTLKNLFNYYGYHVHTHPGGYIYSLAN